MTAIGVITCQALELEIAHVLSRDADIDRILVLKTPYSDAVEEVLGNGSSAPVQRVTGPPPVGTSGNGGLEVVVQVMRVGLHEVIKDLTEAVVNELRNLGPYVDGVVLGYGLCGNALANVELLNEAAGVPVFLPMEEDHPVDDCVGLVIGGRERYYEEQCRCAGTMFMNSGFARYWQTILHGGPTGRFKKESCNVLLKDYKRLLLLPTEVMSADEMAESAAEFNSTYKLRTEEQPGTLEILERTWAQAKAALR